MTNNILIAIPARGGSKRLVRKNLALLGGKPMIAHTIVEALKSEIASDVYVCTEDEEIASVAKEYGAKVFSIPVSMADDEVSSTIPCLHLYDRLIAAGSRFDYIFNLQPTSPLRNAGDIRNALDTLTISNADFLVSVTPIDPHYFHWAVRDKGKGWEMYFGKEFMKERTMLPPVFRPNGAIKLGKALRAKEDGNFFGAPLAAYLMPEERSIHVATSFDLVCAQAMFNERKIAHAIKE